MVAEQFTGDHNASGLRFAIVVSRFNEGITRKLLEAAQQTLAEHGATAADVAWVPGAFEIPVVARRLAQTGRYDAVICLGCVIKGETAHFDYVAGEAARGISGAAATAAIPVTFGVLTTDTIEQALERAGTKAGNKGFDAALGAIEMATLFRALAGGSATKSQKKGRG